MGKLKQLQNIFLQSLLEPNLALINAIDGTQAEKLERLAIYQDGYFYRLYNALVDNFPLLASIMYEDEFSQLITAYIRNYPSHERGLQFFGQQLPNFIRSYYLNNEFPYLSEVAALDVALLGASLVANQSVLQLESLTRLTERQLEQLALQFAANVTCLEFKYNIIELWSSGQLNTLDPVKLDSTQTILIWRKGLVNQYRVISNDLEQQVLKFVLAGVNFNAFCEYLNVNLAAHEEKIGLILQQWVSDELLLNDVKLTNY
ncbi:MAG: putative DNA-binding domain-containing protein [Burkholderiales bacterium]|nr:putative DNA-binding domain-containing protein [Burkholderiales bacterium]MBP9768712.1 putative DNA-binding domain-containing protein [Burkholderiales bacterium]